jgi:hypothetical protein
MRSNIQTPQFPHTLSLYFPHFTPSWNLDDVDDVNVVMTKVEIPGVARGKGVNS